MLAKILFFSLPFYLIMWYNLSVKIDRSIGKNSLLLVDKDFDLFLGMV